MLDIFFALLTRRSQDEKYQKIRGSSVVKGFPELLQRACDKEADARVLLQTEYGLQRRRASTAGLGGPGATSSGSLMEQEKGGLGQRTRTRSDGDLKVPLDEASEQQQTGSDSFMASSTGALPDPNRHHRASSADAGKGPTVNTAAPSSSRHPYGGAAETPRQRAKRKYQTSEQREIKAFLKDREAELVVLVEGIDVMTSATLQVRRDGSRRTSQQYLHVHEARSASNQPFPNPP